MTKKHRNNLRIQTIEIEGLPEAYAELEQYCYSSAILTATNKNRTLTIDLHWEQGKVEYGYAIGMKELLGARLIAATESGSVAGLILRSFTAKYDQASGLPIKELRGWQCVRRGNQLVLQALSVPALRLACETNSETGISLAPEPAVVYKTSSHPGEV